MPARRTRECATCYTRSEGYCNLHGREYRRKNLGKIRKRDNARNAKRRSTAEGKRDAQSKALKMRYGIALEDKERMIAEQGGRCAICSEIPKRLVVDHCHQTKLVRALLCDRCNKSIGAFQDNGALMRAAALYVEKYAP